METVCLAPTPKLAAQLKTCRVAPLAAQLEALCQEHSLADAHGDLMSKDEKADYAAFPHERDAIAERASFMTATSPTGAALQIVLAYSDASCLAGSTFPNQCDRQAIQDRMERLLAEAVRYLESVGAYSLPGVTGYHFPKIAALGIEQAA